MSDQIRGGGDRARNALNGPGKATLADHLGQHNRGSVTFSTSPLSYEKTQLCCLDAAAAICKAQTAYVRNHSKPVDFCKERGAEL